MKMRMIAVLALVTMIAAVAYAQKVVTDSDPSAPFGTYRTYAWIAGTPAPNPLAEERIHAAVEAQLSGKGLMKVEENPNLVVATHVTTQEKQELIASGYGWGPWAYGPGGVVAVQTYVQGTLIVDLYDANTKKMVWRGIATDTVSDKPQKNTKKIDKALMKMFQRYPSSIISSSSH